MSFAKMRIWTGAAGHFKIVLPAAASLVTGSYAATAILVLRTAQNYTAVTTACAGPSLGSLKIVPANPASAISQGTW